jgi:hypothetical protein
MLIFDQNTNEQDQSLSTSSNDLESKVKKHVKFAAFVTVNEFDECKCTSRLMIPQQDVEGSLKKKLFTQISNLNEKLKLKKTSKITNQNNEILDEKIFSLKTPTLNALMRSLSLT